MNFDSNPEFQNTNRSLMIMDDENLKSTIRYNVDNIATEYNQINFLDHLHQRYNVYFNEQPEETDQYQADLQEINTYVVNRITDYFDLGAAHAPEQYSYHQLSMITWELYTFFIVKRRDIALEFLANWLPSNYKRLYDINLNRCNDVLYQRYKNSNPEIAPLMYGMETVLERLTSVEPAIVPGYELFTTMLSPGYVTESHDTSILARYFGIEQDVSPHFTIGVETASRFFDTPSSNSIDWSTEVRMALEGYSQ